MRCLLRIDWLKLIGWEQSCLSYENPDETTCVFSENTDSMYLPVDLFVYLYVFWTDFVFVNRDVSAVIRDLLLASAILWKIRSVSVRRSSAWHFGSHPLTFLQITFRSGFSAHKPFGFLGLNCFYFFLSLHRYNFVYNVPLYILYI